MRHNDLIRVNFLLLLCLYVLSSLSEVRATDDEDPFANLPRQEEKRLRETVNSLH